MPELIVLVSGPQLYCTDSVTAAVLWKKPSTLSAKHQTTD